MHFFKNLLTTFRFITFLPSQKPLLNFWYGIIRVQKMYSQKRFHCSGWYTVRHNSCFLMARRNVKSSTERDKSCSRGPGERAQNDDCLVRALCDHKRLRSSRGMLTQKVRYDEQSSVYSLLLHSFCLFFPRLFQICSLNLFNVKKIKKIVFKFLKLAFCKNDSINECVINVILSCWMHRDS